MNSSNRVRVVSGSSDRTSWASPVDVPNHDESLALTLRRAILKTRRWLLNQQQPEGYWVAELEGDTILESEYILLLAFLGRENSPEARKAARYIEGKQLPDGGWSNHPHGAVDISVSVKAYFALKLTGYDPSSEPMQRARRAIMAHGGADAVNSFTRFYLAMLGQISYEQCPVVPPEICLLPSWAPVNLYALSAWSRTIVVPLSIVSALKPTRTIGSERGIRELFVKHPRHWAPPRAPDIEPGGLLSWDRFFLWVDRAMKWLERHRLMPLRQRAIRKATQWMLARFEDSDGLGAIFPPIVWSVVALRGLGYDDDAPELAECYRQLEGLKIEEDDTLRLQPCLSPVWDTTITLRALLDSGVPATDEALRKASDWLIAQQIDQPGDWSETVDAEPGGWCFEHANRFYPDLDDTAMAVVALVDQLASPTPPASELPPPLGIVAEGKADTLDEGRQCVANWDRLLEAAMRAERWMLAMQNSDGGWGAFDRDNNRQFLCHVPFADHNAMIDPSTPDITGRVLEALGRMGYRQGHAAIDRAVALLRDTQEPDGSWFGRWGINYIYGTWLAITGLRAVGVAASDEAIVAGAQWLLAHQQPDGGWGELPETYDRPTLRGTGPTTASQTAWALLGLIAAGYERHPAVARGVRFLLNRQQADGTWDEEEFTGTGFPRVFYLRYHMYPIYFPLMALSRWLSAVGTPLDVAVGADEHDEAPTLSVVTAQRSAEWLNKGRSAERDVAPGCPSGEAAVGKAVGKGIGDRSRASDAPEIAPQETTMCLPMRRRCAG